MFLGSILYATAYRANFLYLILLGRIVNGFGFSMFMYAKRYCSDSRIVGIRRRTTLAGWLVVGQGIGLSAGPFFGGLLFKIGFTNDVFNGFTSPGWIMAALWVAFWICVTIWYEDDPALTIRTVTTMESSLRGIELDEIKDENGIAANATTQITESSPPPEESNGFQMTTHQWGVIVCMCWYAMSCFFILGAWESNIPVYSSVSHFHWSPFASGNFIALGGITTFPFLLLNLLFARRLQDRHILAFGSATGLSGLVLMIILLRADTVTFASFFICWFLVALGFNVATTVTVSLLSKQLPGEWNHRTSLAIQCSNYLGRVTGAVWGGSGVKVGMLGYVGLEIAIVAIGAGMFLTLYRHLKSKTG
jgi:MFS family permease